MKKVIEASIGSISFALEEDAYFLLKDYLKRFEQTISDPSEAREVMDDVEARVAEIFQKEMKFSNQVVNIGLVHIVIGHLGEIENGNETHQESEYKNRSTENSSYNYTRGRRQLYRNPEDKMIAGVCSGLAARFEVDVTLIRIAFVLVFFAYSTGLWVYVGLWIVAPLAKTIPEKLAMRGYASTAENIKKYTSEYKQ